MAICRAIQSVWSGFCIVLLLTALIIPIQAAKVSPTWQNPDIGLTVDLTTDMHDADGAWKSPGITLRGVELIMSANIDPYASLTGNVLVTPNGAELHEAFALFPTLPLNLKLKGGLMLANFGRWNRFHTHAMPFTSEPRIYMEYAGGMLALKGLELSWLVPVSHFIELTLSAYDRISGHTHDSDPSPSQSHNSSGRTADEIAESIGAEKHGNHWHYQGKILYEEDLYALAGQQSSLEPVKNTGLRRPEEFAYGGRLTTTLELGSNVSVDFGGSMLYQHAYKLSQRIPGETYNKLLWGADIVFFWHPLLANNYRNLQVGAELLSSYEGFERKVVGGLYQDKYSRTGVHVYGNYKHSKQWQVGAFSSIFQSNDYAKQQKIHTGAFCTFAITHYQYLRLEYSRYEYPDLLDGVNRVTLQYDATIGYHTHGRQR